MQEKHFSVAIDGPSGAGKSTIAKAVAAQLGILYVDTGAIYRTIGLAVQRQGIDPKDEKSVSAILPALTIEMKYGEDGLQHMLLGGEDVSAQIRLPEISMYASAVSALGAVRAYLLDMQRDMARKHNVIMDGRDIGTVVLPNAEVKIYLTAAAAVRAQRRCLELKQRGTPKPFDEVLREVEERDYNDSHRALCPLRPAEDSVTVDSSDMTFEQARDNILAIIEERV